MIGFSDYSPSIFTVPKFDPEISIVLMYAICSRPANTLILDISYLLRGGQNETVFWSPTTKYSCQKILYLGFLEPVVCTDVISRESMIPMYSMWIRIYVCFRAENIQLSLDDFDELMTSMHLRTIDHLVCLAIEPVVLILCALTIWSKV